MYDLISIGEILIDLTPAGLSAEGQALYQANPGGAPANVACVAAKFGLKAAFVGVVGDDVFGSACLSSLKSLGVDTSFMSADLEHPTTMAAVCIDAQGNRSFSFYRGRTADLELSLDGLPPGLFAKTRALHFGSLSLAAEKPKAATLEAARAAREAGALVSFDPNYRDMVWNSPDDARREIASAAPLAHILKLSEEEGELLFGSGDAEELCRRAHDRFKTPLVILTMAERGCRAFCGGRFYSVPAPKVNVVDTTGAGDAFLGGLLRHFLKSGKTALSFSDAEMSAMLSFATAVGSLTCTKKGAIGAIPDLAEVLHFLQ